MKIAICDDDKNELFHILSLLADKMSFFIFCLFWQIIRYRKIPTFPINHLKAVWNWPQMQQMNDTISICWMW